MPAYVVLDDPLGLPVNELAARMQLATTDALELAGESPATLECEGTSAPFNTGAA